MGIMQHISEDIEHLKTYMTRLSSGYATVTVNGRVLEDNERDDELRLAKLETEVELKRLETILESGFLPKNYYSNISAQTFYPTLEEKMNQSQHLPLGKHSFFCVKTSRKQSNQLQSSYAIAHEDRIQVMKFFIEHRDNSDYPNGGFAKKVKQGFIAEGSSEPNYAIKIFKKNIYSGDMSHELRMAMRAAYCYQQLGRTALSFRYKSKQYLVSEWLTGDDLDSADEEEIKALPISRRIVMAISLLRELNILHSQGLIHCDIKPGNVKISPGALHFFDMDSVRPANEGAVFGRSPMHTKRYLPNAKLSFDASYHPEKLFLKLNERTDLYALGITLVYLFPDIYQPLDQDIDVPVDETTPATYSFPTVVLDHGSRYHEHPALQKLLKQMIYQQESTPITAEYFIEALQRILFTYPDYEHYLEEDKLATMVKKASPIDCENAFKEIDIEVMQFNQRHNTVRKMTL